MVKRFLYITVLLCITLNNISCKHTQETENEIKLFTKINSELSGITFENKILESEQIHYYKYLYLYIGGGVAAADFNNDGLQDLFFTSNIYHNKLFINKGNLKFEDITPQSGIEKRAGFDTGVSVVDINSDGYLDIYINRAGWYQGDIKLANMLYINNGNLTFTEQAETYGLADTNKSISSTFFDYDKDGDLDVYISNAPSNFEISSKLIDLKKIQNSLETTLFKGSDKLYKNSGNNKFIDASLEAGILPDLGFGLNAQVGDLNNDGWQDIYVSNDFITPDFAYINNGDGTFTDKRNELFKHLSYYSMGSDIGDINNDGLYDLMVLDMSPEDYIRSKTTMSMTSIDKFNEMVTKNYHNQYMHNVLQLNNSNGTFSEVANMTGLSKTDWSWSVLFADFDLDGFNDIYVTNGVYRDVIDRDSNNEINKTIDKNKENLEEKDFYAFTKKLPQQKLTNYFFKNKGHLKFENTTTNWASEEPSFSNGAVYVDLDNDGDLDIVTNNLDEHATLLKNNAKQITKNNAIQFEFKGPKNNLFGVGTTVKLYLKNGEIQTRQLVNARGYLSSVSNTLHFGTRSYTTIPKVEIIWNDGKKQFLKDLKTNQLHIVNYSDSTSFIKTETDIVNRILFKEENLPFQHEDPAFNDFNKQLLLPHKLSQTGPAAAVADLNNDGLDDMYIGGGHNQAGQLLIAQTNGEFSAVPISAFITDKAFEDISACFFDADSDGDLDLYIVSGSYEFDIDDALLQNRLYINNGKNSFKRNKTAIPQIKESGSVVKAADFDKDGDIDLFIGSRVIPGKYPYTPNSYILINNNGIFSDKTDSIAPSVRQSGMVTSAQWNDIDKDDDLDLIITGEWMGIHVYINNNGKLTDNDQYKYLNQVTGWWNAIEVVDIDNDGDKDIIAGNLGLNYKFHASKEKPFHIYTNDFDNNGTEDIMLAKYYNSKLVPVRGKGCTAQQMPYLKERIITYTDFANSDIKEIIGDNFESAIHQQAIEFRSGLFINNDGEFIFKPFPQEAQIAPINSIVFKDFDNDGIKDLLLAGNNYQSEIETTRADAGIGTYLKGINNNFEYIKNQNTGFFANKDVRHVLYIKSKSDKIIIINNNSKHQEFSIQKP
ncbi:ASPIC/UnbV domain-containing protein [Formosa agariphila KMM 3901]|uniref:ASPIC/UnbV domain-containing protein n=1 Tax=Formosa agariphila (strain DSM 15362 / KCTC 12365 / LMG 23005 / KMM 3901 / M-2Alg 35-1) TaxID=1347342 RepID=T2KQU2_FORAG|nr:VCBS repeat-containing protein [Formosa agariphila]CDF80349.1 ASPIC/UnbV domain-containing protein [Formosa agariphila KMM 3901]